MNTTTNRRFPAEWKPTRDITFPHNGNDWPGLVIQWALSRLSKVALYETVFLVVADEKLKEKLMNARKSSSQPGQSFVYHKN
jgi:agmatine deiminase